MRTDMVALLLCRARSCDGMGARCCAGCCSLIPALLLRREREHAAASIHEQKRQSPFTSRAKGETFRGTTLVRQASRRRRTRHPDHHQGHAITGGPGSGSQATFGSTCRERLAPGDLSSLSAAYGLLLLIVAVHHFNCRDCSTTCVDCQPPARCVRVQQIEIEPGAKSVLSLRPPGGSRPKPEACCCAVGCRHVFHV